MFLKSCQFNRCFMQYDGWWSYGFYRNRRITRAYIERAGRDVEGIEIDFNMPLNSELFDDNKFQVMSFGYNKCK